MLIWVLLNFEGGKVGSPGGGGVRNTYNVKISESCKSQSGEEEAADENVKVSEGFDEKLLKHKESFAYKLRKLRAQLFEENGN